MLKKDILSKISVLEASVYNLWQSIIRLKNDINRDDEVGYDNEDTLVFDDFTQLMGALIKNRHPVVRIDNPVKKRLGFACTATGQHWEIGMVDFLNTGGKYKENPDLIVQDANRTSLLPPKSVKLENE